MAINGYLLSALTLENLIISTSYIAISCGIACGIWRNRHSGVNPVVVTIALIFFSCALGHSIHGLVHLGLPNALLIQVIADLLTVFVAIRFLTYYQSFDVLTQISQIVASNEELEARNVVLQSTLKELRQTQAQLVHAEKMSSLGQLVAGVAHEINNPVNFIYGNLQPANEYTQDLIDVVEAITTSNLDLPSEVEEKIEVADVDFIKEDLPQLFKSMKVGADRIRQIVLSLRNFSRLDEADMKPVDIHEGIDSTLLILQSCIKATPERSEIVIEKDYSDLPLVECYASQLNQVFMNLLSNAIDAVEEAMEQGKLTAPVIRIQSFQVDDNTVKIIIADNGIGIPEAIQSQLFEAFFTTKPIGKGTGLGLSISYQIVTEKHGGTIRCVSAPGAGTQFIIEVPIYQRCEAATAA
ncbi:MAG: sensor histidine kinase [Leptolyngbyaceae cyanobacterium]